MPLKSLHPLETGILPWVCHRQGLIFSRLETAWEEHPRGVHSLRPAPWCAVGRDFSMPQCPHLYTAHDAPARKDTGQWVTISC